jgi:hypothetical protein
MESTPQFNNVTMDQSNNPTKQGILMPHALQLSKREILLVLAGILLIISLLFQIPLSTFNGYDLLTLTILTIVAKGFFSTKRDAPLFFVFVACAFLTLYYPIFQIILIYFLGFVFMKVFRVL